MNEISEMSMSSTVANEGQTVAKPMSSKVIYEATRETRTVTDESGNVSKTHSETKNGDGAKVIGVISKNGTFRRVKGGEVEYMTQDDIKNRDVKCLTSENVMKLYQSYQKSRTGSIAGSKTATNQKALEGTDNVSL
ncbi:hypothetical protein LOTGIDRAFT_237074 [Lottia gigantea]|uniref:Uncharacterized protein n=1 Tax=Lottia gigantea TaxID=225164 RepID=V3ZN25_LOTGI|nr:hypothetical protein LOTGIDRAFT_237074 [Lottia gigantea]ESO82241.1 hypothetical protein LOTGIDRAFT_237074 [Lottia gigantea]